MKPLPWIPCLTLLIWICHTPQLVAGKVKAYPAPNADFAHYKTFQWLPPKVLTSRGVKEDHPANPIVKEVLVPQLSQKGLQEVSTGADLEVQVFVLTESVPQLEAIIFTSYTGVVNQGGDVWSTGGPIATMGRYNKEGALYINLIDTKTKKSAWLAMGSDSLPNGAMSDDEIRSKLEKVSSKIFKKYPAKKK
ncbi:MAG TPA: DUF4136 domain-containing protein [Bryobacteraceae bacterium]|nr:DUF4136 domain-containing protein [Bryobacteraceae bacterium]